MRFNVDDTAQTNSQATALLGPHLIWLLLMDVLPKHHTVAPSIYLDQPLLCDFAYKSKLGVAIAQMQHHDPNVTTYCPLLQVEDTNFTPNIAIYSFSKKKCYIFSFVSGNISKGINIYALEDLIRLSIFQFWFYFLNLQRVTLFKVLNDAYYIFKFAKINLNHENKSISNKENQLRENI